MWRGGRTASWGGGLEGALVDAEAHDLRFKRLVGDFQDCRRTTRARNATLAFYQCGFDCFSFAVGKIPLVVGENAGTRNAPRGLVRLWTQPCLIDGKRFAFAQDHGTLDHVLQFADVPWPIVGLENVEGLLLDMADCLSGSSRISLHQVLDQ